MGENDVAIAIHLQNLDDVTIKPTTRHYWRHVFTSLLRSFGPDWRSAAPRITKTDYTDFPQTARSPRTGMVKRQSLAGTARILQGVKLSSPTIPDAGTENWTVHYVALIPAPPSSGWAASKPRNRLTRRLFE
jgi:hypothetical protein